MNSNRQVVIVIKTRYSVSDPRHRLGIVGSIEPLGCWNASQCLLADESPNVRGNWSTKITLPVATIFDWKWVVITEDRSFVIRWEERSNRTSAVAVKSGEIMALWNGDTVFTPVTTSKDQPKDTPKEVSTVTTRQVQENKIEIKPILKKNVSRESSPEMRRASLSSSPEKRIIRDSSPEVGRRSNESSPVSRRRSAEERVRFKTDSLDPPYVVKVKDDTNLLTRNGTGNQNASMETGNDALSNDISSMKPKVSEKVVWVNTGNQNDSIKTAKTDLSDEILLTKTNINENVVRSETGEEATSNQVSFTKFDPSEQAAMNPDLTQEIASCSKEECIHENPTSKRNGPVYDASNWSTDETERLLNQTEIHEEVLTAVQVKDTYTSLPSNNHVTMTRAPQRSQGQEKMRNGVTQTLNNKTSGTRTNRFNIDTKVKCSSVDRFESSSEEGSRTDLRSLDSQENLRSNLKRSPSAIERFFTSMCVIL